MMLKSKLNGKIGPHLQFPKSVEPGKPKLSQLKDGYQRVKIGDLFVKAFRPVSMKDNEKYNLVTVKRARGGVEKREVLTGKQISVKTQFLLKEGDFVTSNRQIVHGACGFVPKNLDGSIVSNEYSVLNCSDLILPKYLNCLIHSKYFQQTCFHSSIGVHVEKMIFKLDDWFEWKIDIPSQEKQEEIASLIETVDLKIKLLNEKLIESTKFNNEALHRVFSKELIFSKSAIDYQKDWCKYKLSDLVTKNLLKNKNEAVSNVLTNSAKEGIVNQTDYFKKEIANQGNLAGYTVVEKDDFVYNPRISELAPVGPIKRNHLCQGVMSPLYSVFRVKEPSLLDYLEQFFSTTLWHRYMHSVANFGARHDRMNITSSDFYNLPVPIPPKAEREMIVDFIQQLNENKRLINQKIKETTSFKKALIQKTIQ